MVQPVVQHLLCLVAPLLLVTAALLAWQPARFRGAGSAVPCQHCNATRVAFLTAGECGRADCTAKTASDVIGVCKQRRSHAPSPVA